jgi:hypothetical protein
MTLASVAMAGDRQMKTLIVGTWTMDCNNIKSTTTYKADGTVAFNLNGTDFVEKWDVKDGALLETDSSSGRLDYFKILFLTKHEWLLLGTSPHNKGYFFYYKDED